MWILANWFDKYKPVCEIVDGDIILEKFHIISQRGIADDSTLMIRGSGDTGSKEEILLTNQNDMICLKGCLLEDILNEVSDAFAYYNRWEAKLRQDAKESEPEQKIIDDCADLFGPIFLIDMEMRKTAMSKQYGMGSVNSVWDDLLLKGVSCFQVIEKLRDSWFFNNYTSVQKCSVTEIEGVEEVMPYNKCIVISQINEAGEVIGQMLINSKVTFSIAEIQLATIICDALSSIKHRSQSTSNHEVCSNFFTFMLNSPEKKQSYKNFVYLVNNWSADDEYCVAILKKNSAQLLANAKTTISKMSALLDDCVITHDSQSIIACLNVSKNNLYQYQIERVCSQYNFRYGVSFIFKGIDEIYIMKRQGQQAIERNKTSFFEVAFDSIINCIEEYSFVMASIHPSLKKLQKYDQKNGTQLAATLKVFLQCERNWVKTAAKLFIHRNTVISRLNKIYEIVDLGLDNADQREYLLFSFRILEELG